jgi:hypothetical protein
MSSVRLGAGWLPTALVVLGLAGCGRGPKLVPVRGRVLYRDGRPVSAASVCFIPDAAKGNTGTLATGMLALDGTFTLRTHPYGDGAVVGPYRVTVSLGRGTSKELARYTREKDTPFFIDVPPEGLTDVELVLK